MGIKYSKRILNYKLSSKKKGIAMKTNAADEIIKVTDVNDYCLEHIFDYLSLNDLLNVGQSNTTFQYAAGIVFKRKYGDDVEIVLSEDYGFECYVESLQIDIMRFKYFISVFGNFISSISLTYDGCPDLKNKKIFEQIYKRISSLESLTEISFSGFPKGCLKKFSKPLPNVKSISLNECDLSNKTVLLSKIFPKLHHLDINCRQFTKHNQIIAHFPELKNLELSQVREANLKEFQSLLSLNPQLSSCLYNNNKNNDWKFVQFIAEKSQLEKFKLVSSFPPEERIHFKNMKHFSYSGVKYSFPFTFDQLEKLELCVDNMRMDNIIKQNEKLIELTLCIHKWNNSVGGFLSKELAEISTIRFDVPLASYWEDRKDEIDALAQFINKKSSAFNIGIGGYRISEQKYLEGLIDNSKWRLNFINRGRYLQLARKN